MRSPWLNFLLPFLVLALLLLAGWLWLQHYTRHGVVVRVPDLQGLTLDEAQALLAKRDLHAVVIDSVHRSDMIKGGVSDQDPQAGMEVKPGRKVYLVVNATQPEMIDMPRLLELSKRQALSVLEILGLKVKELVYKPDPGCTDCVIDQWYQGAPIAPETKIRRGEAITLVLGGGTQGGRTLVPDLTGLTNAEVRQVLNMASLNLGVTVECVGCNSPADSAFARVHRQSPPSSPTNTIMLGGTIDIWLTTDTLNLRPSPGWNDPERYLDTDTPSDAGP